MFVFKLVLAVFLLAYLVLPTASFAQTTYLHADFDDKAIDAPIGTGGPAVGEPIHVSTAIEAVVRDTPLPTPCLEISDIDDYYAGTVDFEFIDGAELLTGHLTMTCTLWFNYDETGEGYNILFRENGSAVFNFLTLNFAGNGEVWCDDMDSHSPVLATYAPGLPVPLTVSFDLDAGTYTIWLDGVGIVWNDSYGIVGSGIGSLLVGCINDSNLEGTFYIDDILVTDQVPVSGVATDNPATTAILNPCYPNPFNPRTTIAFDLPSEQSVSLFVYDVGGRLVDTLLNDEVMAQGRNETVWRGRDLEGRAAPAGVYFYRLEVGDRVETRRMALVK